MHWAHAVRASIDAVQQIRQGCAPGLLVVSAEPDDATVKTLTRSASHVWLMPHNQAYTPIPGDDAVILGKIVTVLRKVE